jgi:peptidoglycan DL-endopeptidase CwlO
MRTKNWMTAALLGAAVWTGASALPAATTHAAEMQNQAYTGIVLKGVHLRTAPSTSGRIITLLRTGEKLSNMTASGSYWYKVTTSSGTTGYVSSSPEYIQVTPVSGGSGSSGSGSSGGAGNPGSSTTPRDERIQKVFAVGRSYLGTPYEYGSNRNDNSTFDCSDFTRTVYREATGVILPADSRQQGAWIQSRGTAVNEISSLQPGDLMFFMSYRGSSDAAYQGIDKSKETITHVGIYLGNGQIMHTYSVSSGGVRIDNLSASWTRRFLYGGSVL